MNRPRVYWEKGNHHSQHYIDLLIAQTAIENNLYLLHDDKDFSLIAQVDERLKEY
ncbi:hypothetical protein [Thermoanaerobacter sp. A7A]|uniref:hypothetical protein n=1 Tax=Thermoanaerobacter sp. A7A TaxID=1350366 RepID=UPI0004259690|nr:hypothetical protein [Thermoanaerobacter sp. A7A]